MSTRVLTPILTREGDGYVALCPELDVARQGTSVEEARSDLIEALELLFETGAPPEIEAGDRDVFVTRITCACRGQQGMAGHRREARG